MKGNASARKAIIKFAMVGDTIPQRALGAALRRSGAAARLENALVSEDETRKLSSVKLGAARLVASAAYYDELERAKRG